MLEEKLVACLVKNNKKISFAESLTGGMCASNIINVSGASKVISASFITYSKEAKCDIVDVNPLTIAKFSVVSEEVACEMAYGAKEKAKADIGIGITGVAGPDPLDGADVGVVCFGICLEDRMYSYRISFTQKGRYEIRKQACEFIYDKIMEILN